MRESGFYWVKDHRSGEWTIAQWDSGQAWWAMGWLAIDDPAFPGAGVVSDSRFSAIGERIIPPPE